MQFCLYLLIFETVKYEEVIEKLNIFFWIAEIEPVAEKDDFVFFWRYYLQLKDKSVPNFQIYDREDDASWILNINNEQFGNCVTNILKLLKWNIK